MKLWTVICFCLFLGIEAGVAAAPLDKSVQVDVLMEKITTLLQINKEAEALPYFSQLEAMDMPLPESFYFYYIDALDKSGDRNNALSRSEGYLNRYGKKGKHYSQVVTIIARLSIQADAEAPADSPRPLPASSACNDCFKMVVLPSGSFQMGANFETGNLEEMPEHRVTINSFAIGKYEVTQAEWQWVKGNNPSNFSSCGNNCPVEQVSWKDIKEFLAKLNQKTGKQYRLPTEAEWEYACRAGHKRDYYCGGGDDDEDAVAITFTSQTSPVGQKRANAFGLYDMNGNVWGWVEDSWHRNYKGAPRDGTAWQGGDSAKRVIRGGAYDSAYDIFSMARAGIRSRSNASERSGNLGFRLARSLL